MDFKLLFSMVRAFVFFSLVFCNPFVVVCLTCCAKHLIIRNGCHCVHNICPGYYQYPPPIPQIANPLFISPDTINSTPGNYSTHFRIHCIHICIHIHRHTQLLIRIPIQIYIPTNCL